MSSSPSVYRCRTLTTSGSVKCLCYRGCRLQRRARSSRGKGSRCWGGDRPGDGWTGEFLVTRCAVAGNPRQPRTRADFMLSRIRVEASVHFLLLLCRERYAVSILLHTKEGAVTIYYIAEMHMYHCLLRNIRCFEESPSVVSRLVILMRFVNRTTVLFFTGLVLFFFRQITNEN